MKIDIIWLVSVLTALVTLFKMGWTLHTFLTRMESKIEKYDDSMNKNTRQILKMSLLCEDLPITDRIGAGKKYIELGGNGYGQIIYNQLLKELETTPPTYTTNH